MTWIFTLENCCSPRCARRPTTTALGWRSSTRLNSTYPARLLAAIPEGGLTPTDLHARLDGTPYVAAAEFADWQWGQTETIFLDADDEVDVDVEWTRENSLCSPSSGGAPRRSSTASRP